LEQLDLKSVVRQTTGNGPARRLRQDGKVPAVLYGPKTDPISLTVDNTELEQVLKTGSTAGLLLNLIIENGETQTKKAMIKEVQRHPISRKIFHIDFYEVDMEKKIRIPVPVVTKGECKGVELGGMLQIIRRELDVLCFPDQIPQSIEIDITDLEVGGSVHVDEIHLEGDVELPGDVNFTVLTIVAPVVEEEPEEEGEEEEGEAAEDETEEEAPSE
jgi:large subunit ribosomal protein L25